MNMYNGKVKIDGVPCSLIIRSPINGEYTLYFERPSASIEQIEGINWRRPTLSGPCELPKGYGFEVKDIDYAMGTKTYQVTLRVRDQYLGDVTGYQAQISALEGEKATLEADNAIKDSAIHALSGQLAEADETAIALYEELEAARAGEPEEAEGPSPVEQQSEGLAEPAEAGEVAE